MKPNLVAPGEIITSAVRFSDTSYITNNGKGTSTSFAAAHVAGLAATLIEHYPDLQYSPALMRAHLMATAIPRNDVTVKSNDIGLGHASGYLAHWAHPNSDGWSTHWSLGYVNSQAYHYTDIVVPEGAKRLVVVLTWDEPPQSAGATKAVIWNLDLWLDRGADCSDPMGACGEYASTSRIDNVEYAVMHNPPAGTYRLKVSPYSAPYGTPYGYDLPIGLAAVIIRGDPTPPLTAYVTAPPTATVGSPFSLTVWATTPSYVASAVQVLTQAAPLQNIRYLSIDTTRLDGVTMAFPQPYEYQRLDNPFTFGNLFPSISRFATWTFQADTPGRKDFTITGWSKTGGQFSLTTSVDVTPLPVDLVETALSTSPPAPAIAPGSTFAVTDTVQNTGTAPSASSTTRFYLSLDATKSADDTLLSGTRSVKSLDSGATDTGTVTVGVPAAVPLASYFLLACADDKNGVVEIDEANNCAATPGAIVTVARPDLAPTALASNPPAPARVPGSTFSVGDTVQNAGLVSAGKSTTRYYLSLDAVKGAGDIALTGTRSVPALAAGAANSGTVTVTIPASTPLATYLLLACADDRKTVAEAGETNNCKASATKVTITP